MGQKKLRSKKFLGSKNVLGAKNVFGSKKVLGQENVIELQKPSLGAEDFAEFLNEIPGAMFRLGVSSLNGCAPLHSSKFDPDERAIAGQVSKVLQEPLPAIGQWIDLHPGLSHSGGDLITTIKEWDKLDITMIKLD